MKTFTQPRARQKGQVTEYALLIAVTAMGIVIALAASMGLGFCQVEDRLMDLIGGTPASCAGSGGAGASGG